MASGVRNLRRLPGTPPEWLVHDGPSRCPYLPSQIARLPLRLPTRRLRPAEFAQRLVAGDRRQGLFLYRPACPSCQACQAIRMDVYRFAPNKTQRRILRRGDALFTTDIGQPECTAERVALYNRHKLERGLVSSDGLIDSDAYEQFLVETCADTFELRYQHGTRLIGVAITDRAMDALSAVYCFYDPTYARFSLGAYSILKQIELCRAWGLRYLYLGLYVGGSRPMAYKAGYLPHERLIDGVWHRFEGA